jgi:hypothetical protein
MIEFQQKIADKEVGFIFSYPAFKKGKSKNLLDYKTMLHFNKLLAKLNHKYAQFFPHCNYLDYPITTAFTKNHDIHNSSMINNEANLTRIYQIVKKLDLIVCLGEKAYFAGNLVKQKYHLNYQMIKTRSLSYPVSRHIKLIDNNNLKHVRTNFNIFIQFKEIERQLTMMTLDNK